MFRRKQDLLPSKHVNPINIIELERIHALTCDHRVISVQCDPL